MSARWTGTMKGWGKGLHSGEEGGGKGWMGDREKGEMRERDRMITEEASTARARYLDNTTNVDFSRIIC